MTSIFKKTSMITLDLGLGSLEHIVDRAFLAIGSI